MSPTFLGEAKGEQLRHDSMERETPQFIAGFAQFGEFVNETTSKFQHKQPDAYMSEDSEHDSIPDTSSFRDAVHFDLATDSDDNFGAHKTKSVSSELHSQQITGSAESSKLPPSRTQRKMRGTSPAPGSQRSGSRSPSTGPYDRDLHKVRSSQTDKIK